MEFIYVEKIKFTLNNGLNNPAQYMCIYAHDYDFDYKDVFIKQFELEKRKIDKIVKKGEVIPEDKAYDIINVFDDCCSTN